MRNDSAPFSVPLNGPRIDGATEMRTRCGENRCFEIAFDDPYRSRRVETVPSGVLLDDDFAVTALPVAISFKAPMSAHLAVDTPDRD